MEVTGGVVRVAEATDVSEARRRAADVSRALAFDATASGRVALVVTEAATNILKHAGGGDVFIGVTGTGQRPGVQVVAMDHGRGMADISASLVDGTSTAGSPGTGLGAMHRSSDSFDVYSTSAGTVVAASIYADRASGIVPSIGAVCAPVHGERECGDAWAAWSAGGLTSVFVVDGLGHGHEAAVAAEIAVTTFRRHAERAAPDVIALVHAALKPTRGAAVALAELDERAAKLRYCAIGNIGAVVSRPNGEDQHLISLPGIAGHVARRVQTFTYDWPRSSLLVMHSDGLGTRWSVGRYAGLRQRRPDVVAGVLYRDHRRAADDATAVVTRHGEAA